MKLVHQLNKTYDTPYILTYKFYIDAAMTMRLDLPFTMMYINFRMGQNFDALKTNECNIFVSYL